MDVVLVVTAAVLIMVVMAVVVVQKEVEKTNSRSKNSCTSNKSNCYSCSLQ